AGLRDTGASSGRVGQRLPNVPRRWDDAGQRLPNAPEPLLVRPAPRYTSAMSEAAGARKVTVDLPEEAFQHRPWSPQVVAQEMRLLWLLEEVCARRLGFGKASELAEVPMA